ncbi:MAG: phage tail protein I [Burkholderiales bacterium]|nr:phage tail protein I [Burkholderiales bacterium]
MSPATLLPPNATAVEAGLDRTMAMRISALPHTVPTLWHADTCPAPLLPYLAWALSVDEWDSDWSAGRKRAVILESRGIHRQKGTPAAIRRSLAALGQPDAQIIERADHVRRNGTATRNGLHRRHGPSGWATYRIVLLRPITIDQAQQIKRVLRGAQRNCVHLVGITYDQAAIRHNGQVNRNGTYARGSVNTELN